MICISIIKPKFAQNIKTDPLSPVIIPSMITIYQQISQAIDFIESRLSTPLSAGQTAESAALSLRSFHTYFQGVTGYTFKEYHTGRRLTEAVLLLKTTNRTILDIAISLGYENPETFTRAFKRTFGKTPQGYRAQPSDVPLLLKPQLLPEIFNGILVRTIPDLKAISFDGFLPDPEQKAEEKMNHWLADHHYKAERFRLFGHNIDREGNIAYNPENEGYRLYAAAPRMAQADLPGLLKGGRFIITGIEGSFEENPGGEWITEGWRKLEELIDKKNYRVKYPGRYFEEIIKTDKPGRSRFDLYLEIENPKEDKNDK